MATYDPGQGKLHNGHAWCVAEPTANQFLQIDFGLVKFVSSIEIQGNPNAIEFVKSFSLWHAIVPNEFSYFFTTKTPRNARMASIKTIKIVS